MSRQTKKVVEYRVYELPLEFPVYFLEGENWRISDVKSNRMHFHNCLEIGICHTDSGMLVFDNEEIPFRAGDISFVPRHTPHTTYSTKNSQSLWSYIFLDLDELLSGISQQLSPYETVHFSDETLLQLISKEEQPRIHFFVMAIAEELRAKRAGYTVVVKSLCLAMYYELLRLKNSTPKTIASNKGAPSFALTPALEYIYSHYMTKLSVDYLAELCCLSTTHFRRIFLSVIGTTPLSFINSIRIDKACVLLLTTDESILSISEAVGFASISSFNRCFQQIMSVSPRDYRNPAKRKSATPEKRYVLRFAGWTKPEALTESGELAPGALY